MRGPTLAPALLACLLAGCVMPTSAGKPVAVLAGDLRVAPPEGYCIDPSSHRETGDSALVLIGRCAGQTDTAPALLTAAIGPAGSAIGIDPGVNGAQIAAFFETDRGRAALSRRGRAKDVTVNEVILQADALLLHLTDRGQEASVQPESWRALLPVDGRLVTLTASGPEATPLSAAAGKQIIAAFVAAMRRANP